MLNKKNILILMCISILCIPITIESAQRSIRKMRPSHRLGQGIPPPGDQHHMHMSRHQTIRQNIRLVRLSLVPQDLQIRLTVLVRGKYLPAPQAPLKYMMRSVYHRYSCCSRHNVFLPHFLTLVTSEPISFPIFFAARPARTPPL